MLRCVMGSALITLLFLIFIYRMDKRHQDRTLARDIAFDNLARFVFEEGGFDGKTWEDRIIQWKKFHKMREDYRVLP